ncbi:TPA: FAD-dependent oxidoreductase [Candidatus Poribacteria bacterium]|nr:FAD-dependent oxidoreductase [Candidatus Poribacteria bacterium]
MIEDLYDIVVIGGGLCGFASAIKAAWNGRKVLLVERRPALGWESTWAFQLDFDGADSTVARRIKDELSKVGGLRENRADAPILEIVLDRMALEAGVSVLLYSYPVRLIFRDDAAFGVVIGNKSGEQIVRAKVIVDATEEALLWRQTDVKVHSSLNIPPAKQTIFFNHAEGEMELPLDLSGGVVLKPSVWGSEVCVEFEIEKSDPLVAKRRMPDILKLVREEMPQLKDAIVTHAGNEPFPITPMIHFDSVVSKHPEIKNFLGAGIWASVAENTPAGRLALGEEIGEMASACQGIEEFPSEMMTGSFISEPEVMSDVLVVGGGTGGAIAAIAAGRQDAKTTLIEASPSLGGIGTGGAIHSYYYGVNGGIQDEVDERVKNLTPLFVGKWGVRGFHPLVKKLVLQQMAEEAGVDILLNTVVTGVLRAGGVRIQRRTETGTSIAIAEGKEEMNELLGVIAVGTAGISAYGAKVFIDSTGDGDVAVMAGAPFIIGREKDNLPHAFSQSSGSLDQDGNLAHNNFDAGYVDTSDVEDLTRGRRLGINQYWREKFTADNRLLYLAPIIGIRQSIQIIGEYQLTLADEIAGRRFEDAVSFTMAHYDNHCHDYENESDEAALWVWTLGNWQERIGCEVPYRCMLPKNVDGLLLACRALSVTYDAHMEFRMQNDIQRIGEVAGIAAAMAAKQGISPREIDVTELQATLKETGILDEKYRPKPAISERQTLQLPASEELDLEAAKELVWISSQRDAQSALALKNMLNSDNPHIRFRASAALAWHGLADGVPELLQCVVEKREDETEGRKAVPLWQAAITFLGIARDKKAVPALIGVLEDEAAGLDALIGAVRSLGRIGDESAIPALVQFLKRENLPTQRVMHSGMGTVEDAKWQLELTAAEALSQLGAPLEEVRQIIEPYLSDARAYVRRYATKILHPAHRE